MTHVPGQEPMLEAVAVCRHTDGREHPAQTTRDGYPITCNDQRWNGAVLRWIVVPVPEDPPDGGL